MKKQYFITLGLLLCTNIFAQEYTPYQNLRIQTYEIQAPYLDRIAEHQIRILEDAEKKLKQQQWQTTAIAIMVFSMAIVGLWLSYLQFRRDGQNGKRSAITLKFGAGSFEISTSVIGLVILALTFLFFQQYVESVYNIEFSAIPVIDFSTLGINQ